MVIYSLSLVKKKLSLKRQAFRIEEALLELDTKLGDFAETQIKVDNYR